MKTIKEIFSVWDTIPQMADAVGESHWTVQKWKTRGRIPDTAWTSVIEAARRKGKQLTAEELLAMHSPPASRARVCR